MILQQLHRSSSLCLGHVIVPNREEIHAFAFIDDLEEVVSEILSRVTAFVVLAWHAFLVRSFHAFVLQYGVLNETERRNSCPDPWSSQVGSDLFVSRTVLHKTPLVLFFERIAQIFLHLQSIKLFLRICFEKPFRILRGCLKRNHYYSPINWRPCLDLSWFLLLNYYYLFFLNTLFILYWCLLNLHFWHFRHWRPITTDGSLRLLRIALHQCWYDDEREKYCDDDRRLVASALWILLFTNGAKVYWSPAIDREWWCLLIRVKSLLYCVRIILESASIFYCRLRLNLLGSSLFIIRSTFLSSFLELSLHSLWLLLTFHVVPHVKILILSPVLVLQPSLTLNLSLHLLVSLFLNCLMDSASALLFLLELLLAFHVLHLLPHLLLLATLLFP